MNRESRKSAENFSAVTDALINILHPYEKYLLNTSGTSMGYSLSTQHILPNKQNLFFAGVQPRKNYISYYLMPVYIFPDLLDNISESLKKHMQGKSCFNFKEVDSVLFTELKSLTEESFERYKKEGLLN